MIGLAKAIQRPPAVKDLVYQQIRAMLTNGDLADDQRLIEAELARQLEVSRTPIREALARLASEGYILTTGMGYRVPAISEADVRHMSDVRGLLEAEAARLSAMMPVGTGIAEMRFAMTEQHAAHQANDIQAFVSASVLFRTAWLSRVSNPVLVTTLDSAVRLLNLLRHRSMVDARMRRFTIATRQGLLDHIEDRAPDAARDWMKLRVEEHKILLLDLFYSGRGGRA